MPSSPESDTDGAPEEQPNGSPAAHPDSGELLAELEQAQDRYKRALADLDNYRKRAAREVQARVDDARASITRDWLEVVDSVERALRLETDDACRDGLRAVLDQIDSVLAREGVRRIGAAGDPFDPELHEAIAVQTSPQADRTILSVERSGFALGDRVIRPAQVVVARAPEHAR